MQRLYVCKNVLVVSSLLAPWNRRLGKKTRKKLAWDLCVFCFRRTCQLGTLLTSRLQFGLYVLLFFDGRCRCGSCLLVLCVFNRLYVLFVVVRAFRRVEAIDLCRVLCVTCAGNSKGGGAGAGGLTRPSGHPGQARDNPLVPWLLSLL